MKLTDRIIYWIFFNPLAELWWKHTTRNNPKEKEEKIKMVRASGEDIYEEELQNLPSKVLMGFKRKDIK